MADFATIILLLGSYDKETKDILNRIREEIAKISVYHGETIFTLLLENVEIYETDTGWVCVETINDKKMFILFKGDSIEVKDVVEVDDEKDDFEILKQLGYKSFVRIPVLEKLRILATISSLVLIVRHRELTRGGEYIELVFLLGRGLNPRIVYLFVKSDVKISTMLKELIDFTEINFRIYESDDELIESIRRILYYKVLKR